MPAALYPTRPKMRHRRIFRTASLPFQGRQGRSTLFQRTTLKFRSFLTPNSSFLISNPYCLLPDCHPPQSPPAPAQRKARPTGAPKGSHWRSQTSNSYSEFDYIHFAPSTTWPDQHSWPWFSLKTCPRHVFLTLESCITDRFPSYTSLPVSVP